MYTIYADDQLIYSTSSPKAERPLLNPKLSFDVDGAGSLTFTLLPGHAQYDAIRKLKTTILVRQDGKAIFRGRVMDEERDMYNQKEVYCEGDLSFLLDSLWEEQTITGNVQDFFRALIASHNKQVNAERKFTVGNITAVGADEKFENEQSVEAKRYTDTSTTVESKLLSVYGGYLRTRTVGSTHYIDWLKEFDEESAQTIRFSVNLLDLKEKLDAENVFTVLIPLGYSEIGEDGTYSDPVNIKSENYGVEYIQDDEAVALYGKIWRAKTWPSVKSPSSLLEKAKDYLKTGTELHTLTIKAVDMHFIDDSADAIRIGTKVQIESDPHGINLSMICSKMDIDLNNPENTTYTFGVKPKTLTEGVIRAEREVDTLTGSGRGGGGGGKNIREEAAEILRWAKISVDEANSQITANAGKIDKQGQYMVKAGININGDIGQVKLMASKEYTDGRFSDVSLVLDAQSSTISAHAKDIKLHADNLVTINKYFAGKATVADLRTTKLRATDLTVTNSFKMGSGTVTQQSIRVPVSAHLNGIQGFYGVTLGDGTKANIFGFNTSSPTITLSFDPYNCLVI